MACAALACVRLTDDQCVVHLAIETETEKLPGAWQYNRPCAQQYVGKSQSCMVISGRLIVHAPVVHIASHKQPLMQPLMPLPPLQQHTATTLTTAAAVAPANPPWPPLPVRPVSVCAEEQRPLPPPPPPPPPLPPRSDVLPPAQSLSTQQQILPRQQMLHAMPPREVGEITMRSNQVADDEQQHDEDPSPWGFPTRPILTVSTGAFPYNP